MLLATATTGRTGELNYTYDAAGRLIAAQAETNTVTTYTYDANGNLLNRATTMPTNADVRITKSSDFSAITIGFDLNFTLTVTNAGPDAATGVTLTDPLPFGLVFSSGGASQGAFSFSNNVVVADLGVVPAGGVATVQFSALPALTNLMTNTAMALADQPDASPANNISSTVNQGLPPIFDSDGDGMPDWWEQRYGLNPFSTNGVNGASGDLDLDGVSNLDEWLADTRANDATSFFHISAVGHGGNVTVLEFQSSPIRRYHARFTPDLNFSLTNILSFDGTGGLISILHTNGSGGFYQLQAEVP